MATAVGTWIGYLGTAIAIIGGAMWPNPSIPMVIFGLVVLAAGIFVRRQAGAPPIEEAGSSTNTRVQRQGSLADGVKTMTQSLKELASRADAVPFDQIKDSVEDLIYLGPARLGEAQEAVSARIGFPAYSEVMGPLATTERLLHRAWSAAADGHRGEVIASLKEAIPYADQATSASDRLLVQLS